jgi:hypothetical protein
VGTSNVGRRAVPDTFGVLSVGSGVDVTNGMEVGVMVKVAVSVGVKVGVTEAGKGTVGESEGMNIVLSAVGVE